jgi:phosphoribosylpyrophosphate synthetase
MSSITQQADFKNHGTFILRINDHSIWYKDNQARMDADYYVIISPDGKQIYRTSTVANAIKQAMNSPNKNRGYLKKLTSAQRKKIAPILRKYNESIKDLD